MLQHTDTKSNITQNPITEKRFTYNALVNGDDDDEDWGENSGFGVP